MREFEEALYPQAQAAEEEGVVAAAQQGEIGCEDLEQGFGLWRGEDLSVRVNDLRRQGGRGFGSGSLGTRMLLARI
jgi:hypothetical protein